MSKDFSPRWGKSVFDCVFCGAEGMQWTEVSPDKWMPYDLLNDEIHECAHKNVGKLNRDDVIQHLQDLGFEVYIPRTSSWKYALIASNQAQTIYFLIRKRGIDYKLYDHVREPKIDAKGKLFTEGGEFVRNCYHGSEIDIHELILEIASRFVANAPIDDSFKNGYGESWKEQKEKYRRRRLNTTQIPISDEVSELYAAFSSGHGAESYLGDGVWVSNNGSIHDRGR